MDWIVFCVGITYFFLGIIGMLVNFITTIAILVDKELLSNPFYYFILHLCIADTICLIASGCYTGLSFSRMAFSNADSILESLGLVRFFGFLINATYYASGWMLVLITLARLISCGYLHLKQKIFSLTISRITMLTIWAVYAALALPCLFHDSVVYVIDIESLTWYYNRNTTWSELLNDYNMVHNVVTILSLLVLDLWIVYKLKRNSPQTNNLQSHRLEIKLFMQCAISGGFYASEAILFAVYTRFQHLPAWLTFVSHMLWISNHINNSVVYLIMNSRLRKTVNKLLQMRRANRQVMPITYRS